MTRPDKHAARFGDRWPHYDAADATWSTRLDKAWFVDAFAELDAGAPLYVRLYTGSPPPAQEPVDTGYTRSDYSITWTTAGTVTWRGPVYAEDED